MNCPVCSEKIVMPMGDDDSNILIVSSVPSEEEINFGKPLVGFNAKLFRSEAFKHANLDLLACRYAYLWYHEDKATKMGKMCFEVSKGELDKELKKNFSRVILIGAAAVKYFTGLSVDDVNGLEVTNEIDETLLNEQTRYFALCNPNSIYKTIGELRFGLNNLKNWLEEA